jgi:hypothetical protein
MSRLLETADGYYYPVPKRAIELGLFGPYLDYVGPWRSEEAARLMEQQLHEVCEQEAATPTIVYRYYKGPRSNSL